jgi:hypothetical protein
MATQIITLQGGSSKQGALLVSAVAFYPEELQNFVNDFIRVGNFLAVPVLFARGNISCKFIDTFAAPWHIRLEIGRF